MDIEHRDIEHADIEHADIEHDAPAKASASIHIAAPIAEVFAAIAAVEDWPRWNADVAWVKAEAAAAPGVGFRWKSGGVTITSRFAAFYAPCHIGWNGRATGVRAVHVFTLAADGAGTRVETAESFNGWLVRLLPGMFGKMLSTSLAKQLAALKAHCEATA